MIASKYFTNSAKSGLDATMVRLFYVTWIRSRFRSSIDHCDEDIIAALASNKWALHIKWLVAEAVDDECDHLQLFFFFEFQRTCLEIIAAFNLNSCFSSFADVKQVARKHGLEHRISTSSAVGCTFLHCWSFTFILAVQG